MRSEHNEPRVWLSKAMSMVQVGNTGKLSLDIVTIEPGAHRTRIAHEDMDEIFYIDQGDLHVYLGDDGFDAHPGDCFEVPAGTLHGSINVSGAPVRMIVCNTPGFDPAVVDEA